MYSKRSLFSFAVCYMYSILVAVAGLSSIGSLAAIAVERLHSLLRRVSPLQTEKWPRPLLTIACIWCHSLVWSMLPLFGVGHYVIDGIGSSCTFDYISSDAYNKAFVMCLLCVAFGLPFSLAMIAYGSIFMIARRYQSKAPLGQRTGRLTKNNKALLSRADIKIAQVSFAILTVFLLSWLPYIVVVIMAQSGYAAHLNPYVSLVPGLFAKASAIYNPFVYCVTVKHFRSSLKRMLKRLVQRCQRKRSLPFWEDSVSQNLAILNRRPYGLRRSAL